MKYLHLKLYLLIVIYIQRALEVKLNQLNLVKAAKRRRFPPTDEGGGEAGFLLSLPALLFGCAVERLQQSSRDSLSSSWQLHRLGC